MAADLMTLLWRATLASSLAIALVLVLRKPLRHRFGAQVAYSFWTIVPVAIGVSLIPAPVATEIVTPLAMNAAPVVSQSMPLSESITSSIDMNLWLLCAWIGGVFAWVMWLGHQQHRFLAELGRLDRYDDNAWRAQNVTSCPALIGAWRPRIVLPLDFDERYTATERALILAHERTHVARADAAFNLGVSALRCVFWFNPLIHAAASRFRFDQELACDASVIARFPEARRPYADAMLKTQLADIGLPVGCHWQSSHPLKERISMLKSSLPSPHKKRLGIALSTVFTVSVAAVAWAEQPKRAPETSLQSTATSTNQATYRSITRIRYPQAQAEAGIGGTVVVLAHVGADGRVISTALKAGSNDADVFPLVAAALAGVQQWTFNPATKNGQAVASDAIVPVEFKGKIQRSGGTVDGALDAIVVELPGAVAKMEDTMPSEDAGYRMSNPPKYPLNAIAAKQSGKIVLKVLVSATGEPEAAELYEAEPPEAAQIFADASIAAVMQWSFNPGMHEGKPASGYVLVPFTYRVTDDDNG
jgi:bla regulator protein BlaR1